METIELASTRSREIGMHLGASPSGFDIFGDVSDEAPDLSTAPLEPDIVDSSKGSDAFRVRLAKPRKISDEAGILVQRRYESRGFRAHAKVNDPGLYTFAAYDSGFLVGTLGVRLDSLAGLKIEQLYADEVEALRARDLRLTEFTRLAVAESAASKEVLGALFHTAVLFSHVVRGCTNVVIEVNPRHVAYYRRVLFFKQLGPERHLDRVGAPAVALVLDLATLMNALDEFFAKEDWCTRKGSFFSAWFSPLDAQGIVDRLRRLDGDRQEFRAARARISSDMSVAMHTH